MNRFVTRALSLILSATLFLSQGVISYATADDQPLDDPIVIDEPQPQDQDVVPDEQQPQDPVVIPDGQQSQNTPAVPEGEQPQNTPVVPEGEQPEEGTETDPEDGEESLLIGGGSQELLGNQGEVTVTVKFISSIIGGGNDYLRWPDAVTNVDEFKETTLKGTSGQKKSFVVPEPALEGDEWLFDSISYNWDFTNTEVQSAPEYNVIGNENKTVEIELPASDITFEVVFYFKQVDISKKVAVSAVISDPAKGKFVVSNDARISNSTDIYYTDDNSLYLSKADLPNQLYESVGHSTFCGFEPALGYYLEGVYTDAAMNNKFNERASLDEYNGVVTDDSGNRTLTLYPNFLQISEFSVEYGEKKIGTVKIGEKFQINTRGIEKPGFTLTLRNNADDSIIIPGETVFTPAMCHSKYDGDIANYYYYYSPDEDGEYYITVSPIYKAKEYTVVYHLNDAKNDVKVTKKHTIHDYKQLLAPTKGAVSNNSAFKQKGLIGWKTQDGKFFDCVNGNPTVFDVIDYADEIGTRTIDIYAEWDPTVHENANTAYTVTFASGAEEGADSYDRFVAAGETVKLTGKELSKKGYVISGWTYEDASGKEITLKANGSFKNLPAKDGKIKLTAKWDPATYTLRFNSNPQSGRNSVVTKTVKYTTEDTQKIADLGVTFKNTGMDFVGWNTKKDGKGNNYAKTDAISKIMEEADATTVDLYAQWKSVGYYVYLDPGINGDVNGSVISRDNTDEINEIAELGVDTTAITAEMAERGSLQSVKYGEDFDLAGDEFVRKGWTLTGWYNSKTKKVIKNSTLKNMTTTTEVIVLTAQWKEDTYKVSYNFGGAKYTGEKLATTYTAANTAGDKKIILPVEGDTFKKPGYTLEGWYDNKNFTGAKYTSIGDDVLKNISLFAKWEKITYKVVLDPNGATHFDPRQKEPATFEYDYTGTLPSLKNFYYRSGYTFDSWNTVQNPTKENPGKKFAVGAKFKNLASTQDETVTLYAQWKPITYKITYDLNGGKLPKGARTTYTEDTGCVLPQPLDREGFTFIGWETVTASGPVNVANGKIEADAGNFGNVTLRAIWKDKTYDIIVHYNKDGDTREVLYRTDYSANVPMTEMAKKLEDETHNDTNRIVSFTTKEDGKGSKYLISKEYSKLTTEGEIHLYAQWGAKDNYTITYEGINYATLANPIYSYDGSAVVKLPNPTKRGYVFTGWTVDKANLVTVSGLTTMIKKGAAEDITLTANFRPVNYKVVVDPLASNAFYNGNIFGKTTYTNKSYLSFGDTDKLPVLTRDGYVFKGYTLTKNYKSGFTLYSDSYFGGWDNVKDNGTVTLYAYWEPIHSRVVFADEDINAYHNYYNPTNYQFAVPKYSKAGYVFKGWRLATDGEYTAYDKKYGSEYSWKFSDNAGKGNIAVTKDKNGYVKSINKGNVSDLLLIADEEEVQYTLKLSPNGGSRIDGNAKTAKSVITLGSEVQYNDDVTDSINDYLGSYQRSGYAFAGFALDSKGKNMIMNEKGELARAYATGVSKLTTKNKGTVTVYAVWEKVTAEKPVITSADSYGNNITVNYSVSDTAASVSYEVQCSTSIVFVNADVVTADVVSTAELSASLGENAPSYKYIRIRQIKTDSSGKPVTGAWSKRFVVRSNG